MDHISPLQLDMGGDKTKTEMGGGGGKKAGGGGGGGGGRLIEGRLLYSRKYGNQRAE